ncbi:hypothetical protein, conserved [Leishmania tarentolae]|uniref:Uncharacterized protein n=1 Tax=Leishmania tarentolae TaxID=5689 RepID=A0A640K980_LEITA|nr:hypothetical protein, conserved [Leishmania tarentolae]
MMSFQAENASARSPLMTPPSASIATLGTAGTSAPSCSTRSAAEGLCRRNCTPGCSTQSKSPCRSPKHSARGHANGIAVLLGMGHVTVREGTAALCCARHLFAQRSAYS